MRTRITPTSSRWGGGDGIGGSADYATGQVNSAVNYGTTIRVPVPRYFTLDESATAARNGFSDETTITQPGGASSDIVITVPKRLRSPVLAERGAVLFRGPIQGHPATRG